MTKLNTDGPNPLQNTYKLSDDARSALIELFDSKMSKFVNDIEFDKKIIEKYHQRLDQYMMKNYPDLSNKVRSLVLEIDDRSKTLEKTLKNMSLREKDLIKSETLYEDVYKMRDEFKEMKKFLEDFQKKMKKVFEI